MKADAIARRSFSRSLASIFRAARMEKNLPLVFLVIGGAYTTRAQVSFGWLLYTLVVLMISSAYMTHLNVVTDDELDRRRKPQLMQWLREDPALSRAVMWLELVLTCVGIGVAWLLGHPRVALGLLVFTIVTILYSYNFLVPGKGREYRLKALWWGHISVLLVGYMALWYTGFYCTSVETDAPIGPYLSLFFFVSLSEYSLFLCESAFDAREEEESRLRTLAAIMGERPSKVVAFVLWVISLVGLIFTARATPQSVTLIMAAFLPAVCLRGIAQAFLLAKRWTSLPDVVFLTSRIITVVVLLYFNS